MANNIMKILYIIRTKKNIAPIVFLSATGREAIIGICIFFIFYFMFPFFLSQHLS